MKGIDSSFFQIGYLDTLAAPLDLLQTTAGNAFTCTDKRPSW